MFLPLNLRYYVIMTQSTETTNVPADAADDDAATVATFAKFAENATTMETKHLDHYLQLGAMMLTPENVMELLPHLTVLRVERETRTTT